MHPLRPSVFILSIQLIRLVSSPNIINTYKIFSLPLTITIIGDTTSAFTISASTSATAATLNIIFSNFISTLNNTFTIGSLFPYLCSAAVSSTLLAAAF